MLCQYLTGDIPFFDTEKYTYLYAAILDESDICIKNNIPEEIKLLLLKMLSKNPEERPSIQEVFDSLVIKDKNVKKTAPDVKTESKKKGFKSAHTNL